MSKVAIVGSGNVGLHFQHVISHKHSVDLFSRSGVDGSYDLSILDAELYDFIFLTVSDDAIADLSASLPVSDAVVIHCSGSRPLDDLSRHTKRGVLYPLQTFSKEKEVDVNSYTLFLEGSDEADHDLYTFARSFHNDVRLISSANRAKLHVAAVFACNFTNHLYKISEDLLDDIGLDLRAIEPLIEETLVKAIEIGPEKSQTGPAIRNDTLTIENHLKILKDPKIQTLYTLLTDSIQSHANKT